MKVSANAINTLIKDYGAVFKCGSGHTKTAETLIYDFPSYGNYQIAIRTNINKLTLYVNAKTRNNRNFEKLLPIEYIEKKYPRDGNPSHCLLSESKAPYLTPKIHTLLRINIPAESLSKYVSEYLDVPNILKTDNLAEKHTYNLDNKESNGSNLNGDNFSSNLSITSLAPENSESNMLTDLNLSVDILLSEYPEMLGEDIDVIAKRRIGQGPFRRLLEKQHGVQCFISGITKRELLIASHIVPWSKSDRKDKVNRDNGLLLSINWDSVFDKGLVTFGVNGEVIFSHDLDDISAKAIGIRKDAYIPKAILNDKRAVFLKYHRENIFRA